VFDLTPIEKYNDLYFKRDDLFKYNNVCGGKTRSALVLCENEKVGFVTAGSRESPQIQIISEIAKNMKLPFIAHCPGGMLTNELLYAKENGAEIVQHKMGFNNNIIKKAKDDAIRTGYKYIPFGMECLQAIQQNEFQVQNIPLNIKRIFITVGSGMSLLGVYEGIKKYNLNCKIIGLVVGADPSKRINKWIRNELWDFSDYHKRIELVNLDIDYHTKIKDNVFCDIILDEVYEAKCISYLKENMKKDDLFWIIGKGIRNDN
jgi:1-aminocyclopropane-1-carboxylate deaminase/D-cysteine desulfhydrase-like pyridoxal-dependent ACC family enzyme